ncbi:MAG: FabA-like domain [Thermoanaerobaculia bacterium]|nr:FabA-like domain [Thermoanaerobaculia bacterium]
MSWLASLPHQIPFRAASAATRIDDKTIEGLYVCTAGDAMPPEVMVIEAMAQLGGGLAFANSRSHAFLSGIDRCEIDRAIEAGDVIRFVVSLDADFGGTFRFTGSGAIDGVEVIRGRFYLAVSSLAAGGT